MLPLLSPLLSPLLFGFSDRQGHEGDYNQQRKVNASTGNGNDDGDDDGDGDGDGDEKRAGVEVHSISSASAAWLPLWITAVCLIVVPTALLIAARSFLPAALLNQAFTPWSYALTFAVFLSAPLSHISGRLKYGKRRVNVFKPPRVCVCVCVCCLT